MDASAQGRAALELRPRDRVVLVGNTLAERMQLFNHFETLLATRFPDLQLTVRNLGWSGDTVALQPRPLNFGTTPTHLYRQKADVILAFFGLNESFDGQAGLAQFEQDLTAYLRANLAAQYNGASAPRLVAGVAHRARTSGAAGTRGRGRAATGNWPATPTRWAAFAGQQGVPFVDLFTPTLALMAPGAAGADDQRHSPQRGRRPRRRAAADGGARASTRADGRRPAPRSGGSKQLREDIREKNQQFFYRWRPVNAEYVVGRRVEPFGSVNFPGEMTQLDAMVAARDRRIWQRAQALKGLGYPAPLPAAGPEGRRNDAASHTRVVRADRRRWSAWRRRHRRQGQRQEPNRGGQLDLTSAGPARGAGAAAARARLRGQPVCLRGAVPRDRQAGGDDLRRARAAVGAHLAHLPAPGAGQDAGRQAGDPRRHRHRRPRGQGRRCLPTSSTCRWGSSSATAGCTSRRSRT